MERLHIQQHIDAINAHWVCPDGIAAAHIAVRIDRPILLTALGSDINVSGELPQLRRQIARALGAAEGASGVSRALAARLLALGARPDWTHYIPNGVNKEIFTPATAQERADLFGKLRLDPARKYLVFVGRLHAVKGLEHLVEALSILQNARRLDFHTLLIGGGELEHTLQIAINERGLTKMVSLVGKVAHLAVRDWLRIGDVFCLPSLMEGMPNVVLEALACGLPIVASRVGAIPDVVNTESGILVPPGEPPLLANALEEAMGRSWDRGRIARDAGSLDWHAVADLYSKVIDAIIAQKDLPSRLI